MRHSVQTTHRRSDVQQCIDNCLDCSAICQETIPHCLSLGGEHAEAGHIRVLIDCADICRTSADFMLRGSDLHHHVCGVCAEICEKCADVCDRLDPNDEQMATCAEMCRRCAESCRSMAGGGRI